MWTSEQRERYKPTEEERREKDRTRKAANPEKTHKMSKLYYENNKEKTIYQNWVRQIAALGCTPEKYQQLWEEQHGKCKICGKEQKKRLSVDHIHGTTIIRGLLCHTCNTGLGCLGDDVEGLERALRYLQNAMGRGNGQVEIRQTEKWKQRNREACA